MITNNADRRVRSAIKDPQSLMYPGIALVGPRDAHSGSEISLRKGDRNVPSLVFHLSMGIWKEFIFFTMETEGLSTDSQC